MAACTIVRRIIGLPCALSSTTSSPVYDCGAWKQVTTTLSTASDVASAVS
jgi:hypothetical protein